MSSNDPTRVVETESRAFHVLHAIYHERDFRVHVNDPTINFVRRTLGEIVGRTATMRADATNGCPACTAGFDPFTRQPNAKDSRW